LGVIDGEYNKRNISIKYKDDFEGKEYIDAFKADTTRL